MTREGESMVAQKAQFSAMPLREEQGLYSESACVWWPKRLSSQLPAKDEEMIV